MLRYNIKVIFAGVSELADETDSKSVIHPGVWVRVPPPAPSRSKLYIACSDFFQKSERAHSAAPPLQIEPAALGFDLVLGADLKAVPRKCSRFPRRGLRIVRDDFLF